MVGPLPALRQRRDRREEAAQHREVQARDGEPAERREHRLVVIGQHGAQHSRPPEREREMHRRARLGGGALRAGADDAGHLDPEPPQRLDVDEADETGADDRCSDVPE